MMVLFVALLFLPGQAFAVSSEHWSPVVRQLTTDLPHVPMAADGSPATVLVHGFVDDTRGALRLVPLTQALRHHLSSSHQWQLVHPVAAAMLDAERGDQPVDHVDLATMCWYARQVGADYVLSGRVAHVGESSPMGAVPAHQGMFKVELALVDSRTGAEITRIHQVVDLSAPSHQASGAQ